VADAKLRFTEAFKKPLPALYSTVVQELLVQQHLFRWNKGYKYTEVRSKQTAYKWHSTNCSQGSRIWAASLRAELPPSDHAASQQPARSRFGPVPSAAQLARR
jgi:hypothetical protein